MQAFRVYLVVVVLCLGTYTMMVGMNHGWNLIPVFFLDIDAMTWAGQFNADFTTFLLLSGLWVAWRNQFSVSGIALAIVAIFGGMIFLAPYLLYLSIQASGNVNEMLLGESRAKS